MNVQIVKPKDSLKHQLAVNLVQCKLNEFGYFTEVLKRNKDRMHILAISQDGNKEFNIKVYGKTTKSDVQLGDVLPTKADFTFIVRNLFVVDNPKNIEFFVLTKSEFNKEKTLIRKDNYWKTGQELNHLPIASYEKYQNNYELLGDGF